MKTALDSHYCVSFRDRELRILRHGQHFQIKALSFDMDHTKTTMIHTHKETFQVLLIVTPKL